MQSSEGFHKLSRKCTLVTDKLIDEAISKSRKRKMVEIFDELSDTLCKVADLSEFLRIAHPDQNYNYCAESVCTTVSSVVEK